MSCVSLTHFMVSITVLSKIDDDGDDDDDSDDDHEF